MSKVDLITGVTSNGQDVYLELRAGDEPLAHIFLGPAEAEDAAQKIADARASLKEEVSRELEPNPRLLSVVDPIWRVHPGSSGDQSGIALILRHPGLGWLTFFLPRKEAAVLGRYLVDHSKPQSPDSKDSLETS